MHAPLRLAPLLVACAASAVLAQAPSGPARQTQADDYTRYELLAPGSGRFRILYEVSATTPGARSFFNPIRKGSIASDEAVFDRMSGQPLKFAVVPGTRARVAGLPDADPDGSYIEVTLARPVPPEGEARLLIDKTYADPKSYFEEAGLVVFSRSLGIARNAVVLPKGYELVSCNVPAQVLSEPDGRIAVSFMNPYPVPAPLVIRARRLP